MTMSSSHDSSKAILDTQPLWDFIKINIAKTININGSVIVSSVKWNKLKLQHKINCMQPSSEQSYRHNAHHIMSTNDIVNWKNGTEHCTEYLSNQLV